MAVLPQQLMTALPQKDILTDWLIKKLASYKENLAESYAYDVPILNVRI